MNIDETTIRNPCTDAVFERRQKYRNGGRIQRIERFDDVDFSHFFELAEQYHERERYLEAAAVYRAPFEGIDDNEVRIAAAYDHYAKALQSALDGYVECVLAADSDQDEFEKCIGALEDRATSEQPANTEQFYRAIDDLEERRRRSGPPHGKRFGRSAPNDPWSREPKSDSGVD